jgi:hypothetical protein
VAGDAPPSTCKQFAIDQLDPFSPYFHVFSRRHFELVFLVVALPENGVTNQKDHCNQDCLGGTGEKRQLC